MERGRSSAQSVRQLLALQRSRYRRLPSTSLPRGVRGPEYCAYLGRSAVIEQGYVGVELGSLPVGTAQDTYRGLFRPWMEGTSQGDLPGVNSDRQQSRLLPAIRSQLADTSVRASASIVLERDCAYACIHPYTSVRGSQVVCTYPCADQACNGTGIPYMTIVQGPLHQLRPPTEPPATYLPIHLSVLAVLVCWVQQ